METLPTKQDGLKRILVFMAENNVSAEVLDRVLVEVKEREAHAAKEAFYTALAEFQFRCPIIEKTKMGATSKYAPLESIIEQVKPLMRELGFSFHFKAFTPENDTLSLVCVLHHINGHNEESPITLRRWEGNKAVNLTQRDAGSITYAKRYAFCNALGIMTGDEDTDGATPKHVLASEVQLKRIGELLVQTGYTDSQILKLCSISTLDEMTDGQALSIITQLERRVKHNEAKTE